MTGRWELDDVAVVAAAVTFALLGLLPWYETGAGTRLRGVDLGFAGVFSLLLALYAAGRVVVFRGRAPKPGVPVTPQAETFVAAFAALLLVTYRVLDVPGVPGGAARTTWLTLASIAVVVEAGFAFRKLRRTGVRAAPPE